MQRVQSQCWGVKEQKCSFCCNPSREIRLALRIVLSQLTKILGEKKYAEMSAGSQENNGAMARLLRVIFDQQQFELKLSKDCLHMRLRNLIKDKLQCRSDQLECIIEDLCDKVARRHYELEIIASQIKNVENSIAQIEETQDFSNRSKKTSKEEESSIKEEWGELSRKESEGSVLGEVKIEELVEPSPKIVQGSPATGLPFPNSFGQMPYSYNFLFYGSYYQ